MGRKPSEDYDFGEPGKWGEDPELIDYVEGGDGDEDNSEDRGYDEQEVG